jgi:hypothetical protein
MAEFWRALKTLKALQAEQAATSMAAGPDLALEKPAAELGAPAPVQAQPPQPAARPNIARQPRPNEPEPRPVSPPEHRLEYVLPDSPGLGRTLHEPATPWTPNEPESSRARTCPGARDPNEPRAAVDLEPPCRERKLAGRLA